jgi:rod shape determining protein RodA
MPRITNILTGRLATLRLIMLLAMLALIAIGIATIYASGHPEGSESGRYAGAWKKQAVFAVIGLVAILIINLFDYRWLGPASYWIYDLVLETLALLLVGRRFDIPFIPVINSTCRWIRIGISSKFVQLQPSEFCKISFIVALAWYLRFRKNYRHLSSLIGPFALTLLAMFLILFEPDLGTVLLMMPVLFAMLFVAGAKVKHLMIIVLLAIVISPLLWQNMNPYQRRRISCVLLQGDKIHADDPENTNTWMQQLAIDNPKLSKILTGNARFDKKQWLQTSGWQPMHSKYAIASGGLKGYGFRKGPYIKYSTLPERHNDFIFAIIAHQWGFVGCGVVFGLYAILIACGLQIAWINTDPFGRLVSVGIVAMFAVEVMINVSMTLGLMPITGLTLPLISYGGSSLLVSMLAVGLLNNIGRHRPFSVAAKAFET